MLGGLSSRRDSAGLERIFPARGRLDAHVAGQTVDTAHHDDNLIARRLTITRIATEVQRSAGQPQPSSPNRSTRLGVHVLLLESEGL